MSIFYIIIYETFFPREYILSEIYSTDLLNSKNFRYYIVFFKLYQSNQLKYSSELFQRCDLTKNLSISFFQSNPELKKSLVSVLLFRKKLIRQTH